MRTSHEDAVSGRSTAVEGVEAVTSSKAGEGLQGDEEGRRGEPSQRRTPRGGDRGGSPRTGPPPPLTNRGGETSKDGQYRGVVRDVSNRIPNILTADEVTVGVDYLCLSAPVPAWGALVAWCPLEGPAYQRGFRQAEYRWTFGGHCKRCYDPHQAASGWGTNYEHWQWGGQVLNTESLERLAAIEGGRASRVDVRFDHQGRTIDVEALEAWAYAQKGGPDAMLQRSRTGATLYLGSPDNDVRIRIYNKASQLRAQWLKEGTLGEEEGEDFVLWRVEVQFRGAEAARWWSWYREDRGEAFERAAGRVRSFSGIEVQHNWRECQAVEEDRPEVLETLWALIDQHGGTIAAANAAGVDLASLARERLRAAGRTTKWRAEKRTADLEAMGGGVVTRLLRQRLAGLERS